MDNVPLHKGYSYHSASCITIAFQPHTDVEQAILCAADPTLENEKFNKKTKEWYVDGIDVQHQCRDASKLYELAKGQSSQGEQKFPTRL